MSLEQCFFEFFVGLVWFVFFWLVCLFALNPVSPTYLAWFRRKFLRTGVSLKTLCIYASHRQLSRSSASHLGLPSAMMQPGCQ